ncbi:MAG: hypothetical protein JO325_18960 [Solirubrobacterales bacterium]|nr:hypothetical protein [Solirubrobacterales bacterium]
MTPELILNLTLAIAVFLAVVGSLAYSIRSDQSPVHGSGPGARRGDQSGSHRLGARSSRWITT